jgi:hypothetical protein
MLFSPPLSEITAKLIINRVHNWFTEGFDTADLKDAKALLEELRE